MTREVWEAIGPFDEDAFPRGYGEETDFCFRAADAGFGMVLATHTFVYHAKSKSYGELVRHDLVQASQETLYSRHGRTRFMNAVHALDFQPDLRELRAKAEDLFWCARQSSNSDP